MDEGRAAVEDGKVLVTKESDEIFDQLKEMGIYGMTVPRELGGMNLPILVYFLMAEIMGRADVGTMTHFAGSRSNENSPPSSVRSSRFTTAFE